MQSCVHGRSIGPSSPRTRESSGCQKPPSIRDGRMHGSPRECTGNACKQALSVHSRCVPKTSRPPTRQTSSDRTASFPRLRESSGCQKPTPIRYGKMHGCPRECTPVALKRAQFVHSFVHKLHPAASHNGATWRMNGWISAFGGMHVCHKRCVVCAFTGPKAPQNAPNLRRNGAVFAFA